MAEHHVSQRLFAEFIGTALLVFIGAGSVPAILLLEGGTKAPFSGADLEHSANELVKAGWTVRPIGGKWVLGTRKAPPAFPCAS